MKHLKIPLILAAFLILVSCGSATGGVTAAGKRHEVVIEKTKMTLFIDDHSTTRRNADRIFTDWIRSRGMQKHVTRKRLRSISPRTDGCHLTYEFRLIDGTWQTVILNVKNYEQLYTKNNNKRYNNRPA